MRNPNQIISFAVVFQVIAQGSKNILVQGFPFFYEFNDMLNIVIMGGSLLIFIYALFASKSAKTPKLAIFTLIFVAITYLFTYLIYPQNYKYISPTILRTLVTCFFTFLLVSKLYSFDYLRLYFVKGSVLITISGVLYAMIINAIGHSTTSEWSTYSMSMSNVMLLSVLWQIDDYLYCKSKMMLAMAIVGSMVIFLYGSRNPFLAIVAFVLIKVLFDQNKKKAVGIKFFVLGAGVIIVSFFKSILELIANVLDASGFSSRTLYYLLNADTEDITTGRAEIHDKLWNIVFDNPLTGLGVSGDEAAIDELAHSMYLSIFVTYGLYIGFFVLLFIICLTIKGLRRSRGSNHAVIILYVCLVFPRSFTGGDIWINDYLWFMMALIVSELNQRHYTLISKNKVR